MTRLQRLEINKKDKLIMKVLVDKCLVWPGSKDKDGYGYVKIKGKVKKAHRIALEIKIGRKLVGKEISMHICHNPKCINKNHLVVGSIKQNNEQKRDRMKTLADKYLNGWQDVY